MTIRSCMVIVLTCNHADHDKRLPDWSSFSGETEIAASMAARAAKGYPTGRTVGACRHAAPWDCARA